MYAFDESRLKRLDSDSGANDSNVLMLKLLESITFKSSKYPFEEKTSCALITTFHRLLKDCFLSERNTANHSIEVTASTFSKRKRVVIGYPIHFHLIVPWINSSIILSGTLPT